MAVTVLFALLIGLPTLRLRGPYFAAADAVGGGDHAAPDADLWEHTGGEEGINGLTPLIRPATRLLLLRPWHAGWR